MKKRSTEKPSLRHRLSDFRLDQRGSALLLAVILSVVGALLMFAGARMVRQSQKETLAENREMIEADNAARAGIADTLGWFRRQGGVSQTAAIIWSDGAFYPRQTPTTVAGQPMPPDTMDENVGLVKEYQISSSTQQGDPKWMRYEVHRQKLPLLPYPTPTVPAPTPTYVIDPYAAHDVTGQRLSGQNDGDGTVWQLTSLGYVFTRPAGSTQPYNQSPCKILSSSAIQTEFRQLSVNLPQPINGRNSALYISNAFSNVSLNGANTSGTQLMGGCDGDISDRSYGILSTVSSSPSSPSVSNAYLCGDYGQTVTFGASNALSIPIVFGYQLPDIKTLADYSVGTIGELFANGVTQLSPRKLYVIDPPGGPSSTVTFTDPYNLSGATESVMIVNCNLVLSAPGTINTNYSGVLYVNGNLTVNPPAAISGVVIVTNAFNSGSSNNAKVALNPSGDVNGCMINYQYDPFNNALQQVAQYRENQGAVRRYTDWLYR